MKMNRRACSRTARSADAAASSRQRSMMPRPAVLHPDHRDPVVGQSLAQPQIQRPSWPQQPPDGPAQRDHHIGCVPRPMPQKREEPVGAVHLQVAQLRPSLGLDDAHHVEQTPKESGHRHQPCPKP